MKLFLPWLAILISFLIGSIPTAYLMGRARGIDIRQHGSCNVGATNAFRVLGKGWGIACLILDMLKGLLPTAFLFSAALFRPGGMPAEGWLWLIGLAAIAGHMFTPFLGFRGGKGVATTLGVVLAIAPLPMIIVFLLGLAIIWLTGYVSVASIIGASLLPFLIAACYWRERPWISLSVTMALGLIIIWKHRGNIRRLRAGTEKKILRRHKPVSTSTSGGRS